MANPQKFTDLGGHTFELLRFVDTNNLHWSAFNPSISYSPEEGYKIAIRSSNFIWKNNQSIAVLAGSQVKTNIWIGDLDKDLNLKNLSMVDTSKVRDLHGQRLKRGIEDPRLIWRNNSWQYSATIWEPETREIPFAKMCTAYLDNNLSIHKLQLHNSPNPRKVEKNWMPSHRESEKFDFVYSYNSVIKDGVVIKGPDTYSHMKLRGGSQLLSLDSETYIAITHTTEVLPNSKRRYLHYFTLYNLEGFAIGISKPFYFITPEIEFAAGLVELDGNLVISFGYLDESSHLAVIPTDKALQLIE